MMYDANDLGRRTQAGFECRPMDRSIDRRMDWKGMGFVWPGKDDSLNEVTSENKYRAIYNILGNSCVQWWVTV